jgi:hypothetical protein
MHRDMRIFVNRASRGRELPSTFALAAAIKAMTRGLADNRIGVVNDAAVWTDWPSGQRIASKCSQAAASSLKIGLVRSIDISGLQNYP